MPCSAPKSKLGRGVHSGDSLQRAKKNGLTGTALEILLYLVFMYSFPSSSTLNCLLYYKSHMTRDPLNGSQSLYPHVTGFHFPRKSTLTGKMQNSTFNGLQASSDIQV